MKRELPQSAREMLARQTAADAHPSADLLNGYAEQSLTAAEKNVVANHLATCADCREIVFLASPPMVATVSPPAAEWGTQRGWRAWKWMVAVSAACAIVAGVVVNRHETNKPQQVTVALTKPVPSDPQTKMPSNQNAAVPAAPPSGKANAVVLQAPAKEAQHKPRPPQSPPTNEELARASSSTPDVAARQRQAELSNSLEVTSAAPLASADQRVPSAAPAGVSGARALNNMTFASRAGNDARYVAKTAAAPQTRWRIVEGGMLERASAADDWTRVLAEQPVSFSAVDAIAGEVWAGGNDGALFHSHDGGVTWTRVALVADSATEHGAVVSIQFSSSSQGVVKMDSGATWATSDGGQSWTKQ